MFPVPISHDGLEAFIAKWLLAEGCSDCDGFRDQLGINVVEVIQASLDFCSVSYGGDPGGHVQQVQEQKRQRRREIRALIDGGRYDDLLKLLEPAVAAEHVRLHGGNTAAAAKALCTPFPTRPLIESYLFGKAERVLRTLRYAGLLGSRQDLVERLEQTTLILTD